MDSEEPVSQRSPRQARRKNKLTAAAAGAVAGPAPSAATAASPAPFQAPKPEEAVGSEARTDAEATVWERTIKSSSSSAAASLLPLVATPLACRILQKLWCAYDSRRWGVRPPVLLHGPPGSGKSSCIRWLSQLVGMKQPPICLFLDQQTEAKDLVGSWVCGRRAGEFEWHEGILSRCVREGRWVVIEQLQQLAHDVHALLHGLAATGFLTIHEQQRRIRAHPNFALFATLASPSRQFRRRRGKPAESAEETSTKDTEEALDVALTRPPPQVPPLLESWVLLHVPAPSAGDVLRIATRAFPSVSLIVSRLQRAFHAAAAVATAGVARPGQPPPRAVRLPQLRDFLKLCRRLEKLANSISSSGNVFGAFLTDRLKLRIVEEGATVLLGHINDRQLRFRAVVAFAREWAVQEEQVEAVLFTQRPAIRESAGVLHVGPYALPKCSREEPVPVRSSGEGDDLLSLGGIGNEEPAAAAPTTADAASAAGEGTPRAAGTDWLTGQQLRLVQQAGGALSCGEPLLFVGDTGAGKTFIVSFIAARVGVELMVVNLHQQSESEDLIGRWVLRHPPQEAESLWGQFLKVAEDMLGPPSQQQEKGEEREEAPKAKKRKQQARDGLIEAARQMVTQVQQRGSRLLQREAWVALLQLAVAANTALLQLLRKRGDLLPVVTPQQPQQRTTAGELLARCKELQASGLALLEDPDLSDCSAAAPRNFGSTVEACGLRDFLPAARGLSAAASAEGAPRRRPKCQLHFAFTEGPLVEAVRTGKWLLLDEINLAPPDLLQRLLGLLDDPEQPLLVLEGGRPRLVSRHPNFRVFACMNPPTLAPPFRLSEHKMSFEEDDVAPKTDPADQNENQDHQQQQVPQQKGKKPVQDGSGGVGKRELPVEVRQRFTELYVDETDGLEDIAAIADAHLRQLSADPPSRLVAEVYIHLRCLAEAGQLLDGNNKTPCYSLRTLSRALLHTSAIVQRRLRPLQLRPALREGFAAFFGSSLDPQSADRVDAMLTKAFRSPRQATGNASGAPPSATKRSDASATEVEVELHPASPGEQPYVTLEGFLIHRGAEAIDVASLKKRFVLTPRSQVYMRRVVRLLSGSRCALLLEGPTSCGKTSLVSFLAAATGHKCVRINNHEHTDIQEYIGSYAPDAAGRLVFTEGPLTLAVRHGWWVLIDELNLAPSEVLEALNRLLDSNRELLLPPTGALIKAHPDFQLFGTQNPAGLGVYGGRKVLSKALANRFVQLQLEEFGIEDLRLILTNRCKLPASRVDPMLKVFRDLQQRRANSSVFFGSHGFMTIRDLIRWGRRVGNSPFQHHLQQQQQQQQQQKQHQRVHEFAPTSLEEVALEGWLLVGERLRTEEERAIVRESLEKHCLKSTPAKPKPLVVDFAADPYVAAFRRLLEPKMERCMQLQRAAAEASAAAAAAAARAASLRDGPAEAREEAETAAAAAAAAAAKAAFAAPELPAFLPFSFNAASLRLLALTLRALAASENLLLVGDTGAGKTAVCELIAWTLQPQQQQQQQQQQEEEEGGEAASDLEHLLLQRLPSNGLYAYNCHLQMEASELLGCMHPVHQGEMLQQQRHAFAMQSALLRLLEEPPTPKDLLPGWESLLQRPAAAAAAAAAAGGEVPGERLERRYAGARDMLLRFHTLLQAAAADVLICLRASRDRAEQQQQEQQQQQQWQPLQEEDAGLFSRALRKAAKGALEELEKETERSAKEALERETKLRAELVASEERLQQHEAERQRLSLQQHQQATEEQEDVPTKVPEQQQQHGTGTARKRQRKGGRNRPVQQDADGAATAAQEAEAAQKRRRKGMDAAAAAASSSPSSAVAADTQEAERAAAATALVEAAAAAAAALEEAKADAAQQAAAFTAAVAAREDLEASREAALSLISGFAQRLREGCGLWLSACNATRRVFYWKDGPLVRAMREGAIFLLDEASLAQDAVLERLNSVLEDGKHLLLTEQGVAASAAAAAADEDGAAAPAAAAAAGVVDVVAAAGFRFIATMNPGGDYGKRELSPALRNRLTEIYVPAFSFYAPDAALLLLQRLQHTRLRGLDLPYAAEAVACARPPPQQQEQQQLLQQELRFLQQQHLQQEGTEPDLPLTLLAQRLVLMLRWARGHLKQPLSIRDAFCWICFIDRFVAAQRPSQQLSAAAAADPTANAAAAAAAARWIVQGFVHGGCLLLLDGLGVGAETQLSQEQLEDLAEAYVNAEGDLFKARKPYASPQELQQQQQRLELLRGRLQQQLDEAATQPARRPHLAILLLLKTHACRLYRDFGLHRCPEQQQQHQQQQQQQRQQQQQQQQQQEAIGPSWDDTCKAFGRDGFAWVADAFAARQERICRDGGLDDSADIQIGPFSLAAFKRPCPTQQQDGKQERQQQQQEEELPQVVDSPSVQRSLGRLLRCLLLLQQTQQDSAAAGGSSRSSSGRHAVLLEGPPGAGKTFVVSLLARLCGRRLVRINLSEDTELADLLGSFVPAADGEAASSIEGLADDDDREFNNPERTKGPTAKASSGLKQTRPSFVWTDGVLTRHLRAGNWVLLDELNLAPQQTLEGLNPLLDHRRCIYLPTPDDPMSDNYGDNNRDGAKKGAAVFAPPGFVLFATQNPHATAISAPRPSGVSSAHGETPQSGGEGDEAGGNIFKLLDLPGDSNQQGAVAASRKATGSLSVSKAVGGRKGLPQSLLNRFCRIRVDEMLESDMVAIANTLLLHLQRKQQQEHQQQQQKALVGKLKQETEESRQALLLSACVVRCVRLMGTLAAERPFQDMGDTAYNLRDVTRVIHLLANKLPSADPKASVAVALLSRLRCRRDVAAAAGLVARCFPPRLFELLREQQTPQQPLPLQQQRHQNDDLSLDGVAALLSSSVAPDAILAAVTPHFLLAAQKLSRAAGGAVPVDLLVEGDRVLLGGMVLAQDPGTGPAATKRECAGGLQQEDGRYCGLFLHSQRRCVGAVAAALKCGFPVVLTGERGGGKSSIVRWLAAAWGAEVCEVQLAPSVDTSDLLGFYRQIQPRQRLLQAAQEAHEVAQLLVRSLRVHQQQQQQTAVSSLEELQAAAAAARERLAEFAESAALAATTNEQDRPAEEQPALLQQLAAATAALLNGCDAAAARCLPNDTANGSPSLHCVPLTHIQHRSSRARRLLHHGCALGGLLGSIRQVNGRPDGAGCTAEAAAGNEEDAVQFEWIDSALVGAVREGRWLLLRDAHLCSPSVLDRLNALLEDGGSLLLTEGGSPRLVKKNPAFRVILTADASKAHLLSAALRNRCCEVYMHPPGAGASAAVQPASTTGAGQTSSDMVAGITAAGCVAAGRSRPLLLQGLTDRLLQTLAAGLRRARAPPRVAEGGPENPLDSLLARWATSLLSAAVEDAPDGEGAAAPAAATLHVLGAFIEFRLRHSGGKDPAASSVRLCPLLLQDGYRLLLAGDAGRDNLSLAAAEVMALQHAAIQVLLQLLGDERAVAAFAAQLESELSLRTSQEDLQQQQQHQQQKEEACSRSIGGGVPGQSAAESIRGLREALGEANALAGLYGLQSLARRVAAQSHGTATAAAAASWRCLQGWGSAYVAAARGPAASTQGTAAATAATAGDACTVAQGGVYLERIFQSFLWQYTAALDSSATWRLVLLHLLAACCCCCCSSSVAEGRQFSGEPATRESSKRGGAKDCTSRGSDWAILRGGIHLHVVQLRCGDTCSSWRVMGRSVTCEMSLLTSVFAELRGMLDGRGLSLMAALTRHFLWGAASPADLKGRLQALLRLQDESDHQGSQQQRAGLQYLLAACTAVRQVVQEPLLLPQVAAKVAAASDVGETPANGQSLLYAAARLVRLGRSSCCGTGVREHTVLLLQELIRLLRLQSTAWLLPERLLILGEPYASITTDTPYAALCTAGCPVCGVNWNDAARCLFSLLADEAAQHQELMAGSGQSTIGAAAPQCMQQIFDGLRQLAEATVSAASAVLLSSSSPDSEAAAVAAGHTEQCRHLARCFRGWVALLQLLCLPICWHCHHDATDTAVQQRSSTTSRRSNRQREDPRQKVQRMLHILGEPIALRMRGLAGSLQAFVEANERTAAAIREQQGFEDLKTAAATAATAEFVSAELIAPLLSLQAVLKYGPLDDRSSPAAPLDGVHGDALLFPLDDQEKQMKALLSMGRPPVVSGSASGSLLPVGLGQQHVQSVGCWLLRDILMAAAVGEATAADPAGLMAAGATTGEGTAAAATPRGCGQQQRSVVMRRFATSAPSLGRAYDLLKLAVPPSEDGHTDGTPVQDQGQQQRRENLWWWERNLPQPHALLPHASALLALLLSSSLLRAEGRDEAAARLETRVTDLVLPAPADAGSAATAAASPWDRAQATAVAVRAAAAAEGVLQSRQQQWVAISSLAVASLSLLQAELATRAAVHLGVQHAAELLLLHLSLQLHQSGEDDNVGLAATAGGPSPSPAALSLMLETAVREQLLRQQQDLLPVFTSPAAAYSPLSLEGTSLGAATYGGQHNTIPFPPALLEATAVLTAAAWQQQQQRRAVAAGLNSSPTQKGGSQHQLAAGACVALETLCSMWRTEIDLHCNDALGLQLALQMQQRLQEGDSTSQTAAPTAGGMLQATTAVLSWQTWASLAETAGGFRGVDGTAAAALGQSANLKRLTEEDAVAHAFGSSCGYAVRILVEVQQHATVSSTSACFMALQRLRRQLQLLDEDGRRVAALLPREPVGTSEGIFVADTAEWAAVMGFSSVLWSFCSPVVGEDAAQDGAAAGSLDGIKKEPQETAETRRRRQSLAVSRAVMAGWRCLAGFLRGRSAMDAAATAKEAAEELRSVMQPIQQSLAAAAAAAAAEGDSDDDAAAASGGSTGHTVGAARSAVASMLLLAKLLERCAEAGDPATLLQGDAGAYWRGMLLLLLGRWAVLTAAAAAAADLQQRRAVTAWRQAVSDDLAFYEVERMALLLRGAALDGCDGGDSLAAATGASTSASMALAAEAEAHAAALQQLLLQSQEADAVLQDVSRFLPLRSVDIPAYLALRLTKPWMSASITAAAAAGAAAAGTAEGDALVAESRMQVLRSLRQRSTVEVTPDAALALWLGDLQAFADSTLDAKNLSAQLPELASLLLGDGKATEGRHPSSSVSALRTAAEAAAACSSRLAAAHPLICAAAVRTATTGLVAVTKGLLDVAAVAGSVFRKEPQHQRQHQEQESTALLSRRQIGAHAASPASLSLLLRGTASFPSLPLAAPTCGALCEGCTLLPPVQRAQWLLLWLRAEAAGAAAKAAVASSSSKTAVVAAGEAPRSTIFAAARLTLARLLKQVAQKHLAWRRQQEIAADDTATLLQRLEGLVVDRTKTGKSCPDAEAAQELFPCSDEWGQIAQKQQHQQQQETLQEDGANDESTQYTTWCQQTTAEGGEEDPVIKEQQQALQFMDGLSEADLLHLWGRAVDAAVSWSGSSSPYDGDGETTATATYREALAGSFCILLQLYNMNGDEAHRPPTPGAANAGLGGAMSLPVGVDVTCAPHLQALLMQTSARLIDASPLQQQQQEQQLKQLLLQDDEAVAEEAEPHQEGEASAAVGETEAAEEEIEQQLQQERLQQQRERARKLRFAQLCRSVSLPGSKSSTAAGAATSFYAPGNPALLQPLCRPVQQLQEAAAAFVAIVEDHPALQGLLLLSQRVASLSLSATSAADALAALEGLLDRAAAWQKAMDRHHLAHLIALHFTAAVARGGAAEKEQQSSHEGTEAEEKAEEDKRHSASMAAMEQQQQAAMDAAQRLLQRFDLAVGAVERQVLLLRRRQLLEWRFLREFRERRIQQQSLHFAPFLWALLPDDGDTAKPPQAAAATAAAVVAATGGVVPRGDGPQGVAGAALLQLIRAAPMAVTDVLVRFLRTSPLGQFEGRLRCMEAASQCRRMLLLHATAAGDTSVVSPVAQSDGETDKQETESDEPDAAADGAAIVSVAMGAVARFAVAAGWRRAVQQQLHLRRKEMDREVTSLASLARWNLSSRAAMKESVHKTHVQLAKHIRNFDGSLLQLTEAAISPSEWQLHQQLVTAALALPLQSPLAVARRAAEEQTEDVQERDATGSRKDSSDSLQGVAAATATNGALQKFLEASLGLAEIKGLEMSHLADLHAFSSHSSSASDVAVEVQAFCHDFMAAVKEAAAAAARDAEEQQQQQEHKQPEDDGEASKQEKRKKKPFTRQQMQRRFADLRSMLRSTLKLPCLSMCGGAPGLFAAALNDVSGLPGPSEAPHPLQKAAALQRHDTARTAAACFSRRKNAQAVAAKPTGEGAASVPLEEMLGGVWSSAAQQWYLLLQTLLHCQQFPSPHRDVAGDRDALLGFAAALVLHVLQQRDRCWRAAAEYQELADVAAICLVSPSVRIPVETASGLLSAAETLEEGLRQARAMLPSEREATVQNEALQATIPPHPEALGRTTAATWGSLADQGGVPLPSAGAGAQKDERRLLEHNVRELREAHTSISAALRALEPLQQLLKNTAEARCLSAGCSHALDRQEGDKATVRVRLQWLEDARAACAAIMEVLEATPHSGDKASALLQLLPSHAAEGLRAAWAALNARCAALTAAAGRTQAERRSRLTDTYRLLDPTIEKLRKALEASAAGHSTERQPCGRDSLLQLPATPDAHDQEHQPVFDTLPVPPLTSLFSFKEAIAALHAFDEAAPPCIPGGLLQEKPDAAVGATSDASAAVLRALQRAGGVLLAAFDGLEGTARLGLSLLHLLLLLLQLGWGCLSNEEEEAAAAAAGQQPPKQKDEWVAGTGLGEGEGARDASDQIEEEWQFDGLKDEKTDPQQKPPEKPKSQEEDKAMEVSMDFEGEAEAPPPKQQEEDQKPQQQGEEAQQQREDVAGSVDLQEGGKIEDKRWAGEDDADREDGAGHEQKGDKRQEDIQTEGGVRQGGIEMEGTNDESDESPGDRRHPEKQHQQQQQQPISDQETADEGAKEEEDEGKLEGPSTDGDGDEQQKPPPEYQQKLQKPHPSVDEETRETQEEVPEQDADEEGIEMGDAAATEEREGQQQQQEQQQIRGEGITDGWGEDVELEEDIALDGEPEAGEEEEGDGDAAPEETEAAAVDAQEGNSDAEREAGGKDEDISHDVQEMNVDAADCQPETAGDNNQQQDAAAEGVGEEADDAAAPQDGNEEDENDKKQPDAADEKDGEAHQDPSVQGLVAPRDAENPESDEAAKAKEKRQQQPKQQKERQRMAFGIEGDGSLVQRETMEGDAEDGDATGENAAEGGKQEGGDAAAAGSEDGGALARSGTESLQQTDSSSSGKPLPPNLLPDNPLEDDNAVERWLQRVRLLQQNDGETDGDAPSSLGESERMEVEGEGAEARRAGGEDPTEKQALQRGQLCQRDDAAGGQEALAEASEAAASKRTSNAKLADAENSDEQDGGEGRTEERGNEGGKPENERILSTVSRADSLKASLPEEKREERNSGRGNSEAMEATSDDEDHPDSEQLFQELSAEPGALAEKPSQQQQQQQQEIAAGGPEGQQAVEDAEEQMAAMEADFQERVTLDDVGKEGLSPEHAAILWHLLEGRTAASAAALSESLRLVLQPTANGAWEAGYRSGKKLSLRRVLAFVASSQRDDRLWLRRRRPRGLQYRVLVGIDCSRSMQQLNAAASALEAVVLLSQAFNHLQIGTVSVCTFGGPKPEVCVHSTPQVSAADGQRLLQRCSFREESHKSHEVALSDLLQLAIHELEKDSSSNNSNNSSSMILILSDGRFNKEQTRPWVNAAIARRCIPVLLILDPNPQQQQQQRAEASSASSSAQGEASAGAVAVRKPSPHSSSIFDLKQVQQQPGGGIEVTPYLQDFPFPYYAVVYDTEQLPSVLSDVIRQWVEAAANDW